MVHENSNLSINEVATVQGFKTLTRALALCQSESRNYGLCVVYIQKINEATLLFETW